MLPKKKGKNKNFEGSHIVYVGNVHTHTHTYIYIYIYIPKQIYTYISISTYTCIVMKVRREERKKAGRQT